MRINANREIVSAVVWHLANGKEHSRTDFVFKEVKNKEAVGIDAKAKHNRVSSIPSEASDAASETNSSRGKDIVEDVDEGL